jgi:hypothetical protein
MELDAIEHLAAKYLEVGGTGRLDSHRAFIRIAEAEPQAANALWQNRIDSLTDDDRRRFELLVEELRVATN